jgi:hypothetical protein
VLFNVVKPVISFFGFDIENLLLDFVDGLLVVCVV